MLKNLILYLILGVIADQIYVNYILGDENIEFSKRIFHILFWLPAGQYMFYSTIGSGISDQFRGA